jgi:asparagine synthase (glutamine-hydrolysing)
VCGVLGIVDRRGPIDPQLVAGLRDLMVHRGPDAGGVFRTPDGRVALAHRRLSILDLSERANQPMAYRGLHVTYNGEIFNYERLRAELEGLGHAFRTRSDTEVLLAAWAEWGEACLARLEGMFAFLLYEEGTRRLHAVRDRLGIKPLYYHLGPDVFVAASELRAVEGHPDVPRDLDPCAVDEYLTYRYVPPPRTIWKNVCKLAAGERLILETGKISKQVWWDIPVNPESQCDEADRAAAREELAARIDASVRDYLVSDVPVGVFLSGGWDSSVVTACARRHYAGDLHAFSIGFDVERHSELELARRAAAYHGVLHHETRIDAEAGRRLLDELVDLFEEPWMASSGLPMLAVARLAREYVTVGLSGDGGDEVFGGYAWYRRWPMLRRDDLWNTRGGRRLEGVYASLRGGHRDSWWRPQLGPVELFAELHGAIPEPARRALLGGDLRDATRHHDSLHFFRAHYREELPPITRLQYLDAKTFLPEMCLAKVDRTTMATSLEARTPLLNHELVEWAFSLPSSLRNPGGALKGLLKEAVRDRVPPAIRAAPKKGFSAPADAWFDWTRFAEEVESYRRDHPAWARRLLASDFLEGARRLSGPNRLKWWQLLRWARRNLS